MSTELLKKAHEKLKEHGGMLYTNTWLFHDIERELNAVRAAGAEDNLLRVTQIIDSLRTVTSKDWVPYKTVGEALEVLDNLCAELVKDAQAAKSTPGVDAWQDIETAPKDQTRILCSYRGNRPFIARWRNDFSVFMDDWDSWRDATHWMPLPRPIAVKREADQEHTGGAT